MSSFSLLWILCLFVLSSVASPGEVTLEQVQNRMRSYLSHVDSQIRALDYLLDRYYRDWNYTEEDAHEHVSNPINTYMLIKRTGLEWPNVKKVLFNETAEREAKELEGMIKQLQEQKDGVKVEKKEL